MGKEFKENRIVVCEDNRQIENGIFVDFRHITHKIR